MLSLVPSLPQILLDEDLCDSWDRLLTMIDCGEEIHILSRLTYSFSPCSGWSSGGFTRKVRKSRLIYIDLLYNMKHPINAGTFNF